MQYGRNSGGFSPTSSRPDQEAAVSPSTSWAPQPQQSMTTLTKYWAWRVIPVLLQRNTPPEVPHLGPHDGKNQGAVGSTTDRVQRNRPKKVEWSWTAWSLAQAKPPHELYLPGVGTDRHPKGSGLHLCKWACGSGDSSEDCPLYRTALLDYALVVYHP
ncbi:hypothetical protein NDU88_003244 [Pleurodeles waltl]|uniref:Uncharacterized protein n=1 Tax=Pleurodeles waltl TaxID=8319 RepID=A0AAV7SCX3_PLEWA|nr:hypothetical protein NDU88_003244 [Pleurodeles waltl]